jgi:hypothetical protein
MPHDSHGMCTYYELQVRALTCDLRHLVIQDWKKVCWSVLIMSLESRNIARVRANWTGEN